MKNRIPTILTVRPLALATFLVGVALLLAGGARAHAQELTVTITSGPEGSVQSTEAVFTFTASARAATFSCSLDGARLGSCSSPTRYSGLGPGSHEFEVRAALGSEVGAASRRWTIVGDPPPDPPQPPPPGPKPPAPPPDKQPPPPPPCGSSEPNMIVICFDDLAAGTVLKSQYAGKGVEVGYTPLDPLGGTLPFPEIEKHPAAFSGDQVARTPSCATEICSNILHFRFTSLHRVVRVRAGGGAKLKLAAFNQLGKLLVQTSKWTVAGGTTILELVNPAASIAYFTIGQDEVGGKQKAGFVIDDLAFDPPDPNAKPDFGLGWIAPWGDGSLSVARGGTTTTTIHVSRFNGSAGGIQLKTGPLPQGVSVAFQPATAATLTKNVVVKVTAAANAPILDPAKPIAIIGHPVTATAGYDNRFVVIPLLVLLANYDVAVTGIEVTQGIQKQIVPYYSGANLSQQACTDVPSLPWLDTNYTSLPDSVLLVKGRKTVARVFARLAVPADGTIEDVPAKLYGTRNGQALAGSPLSPFEGARDLESRDVPYATCLDRADPAGAYTFILPNSWTTGGPIALEAKVLPQTEEVSPGFAECGSAACLANNTLKLTDVLFTSMPVVTLTPVLMTYGSPDSDPPVPVSVFKQTRYFSPSPLAWLFAADDAYAGVIDIDMAVDLALNPKLLCPGLLGKIMVWGLGDPAAAFQGVDLSHPHGNLTVGVFGSSGDVCPGISDAEYQLVGEKQAFAVVAADRPLTSVAHEIFHGFGRKHADTICGGNSNGEVGEDWQPDQRGHIHGIGLDTRAGSGPGAAPFRPIVPGALLAGSPFAAGQPDEWVDFMSYCWAEDPGNVWISDRGWNTTAALLKTFELTGAAAVRSSALQGGSGLSVTAVAGGSEAQILAVQPVSATATPQEESPWRLIARDGAGAVVADVPMTADAPHVHDGSAPTLLFGAVAAPSALSIEVVRDGVVLARRVRSANAPAVAVLSPRRGERVGQARTVDVRWRATDPDGGRLEAEVDYSTDGGRRWRTIYVGPSDGRASLPSTLFAGARQARLRIRVSDGFTTAEATSAPFEAVGRPPSVTISEPVAGEHVPSDNALYLAGSAYDDGGHQIGARRLAWFDGRKRIGTGPRASASGLAPGLHVIRLAARDARGRIGSARVRVRISPSPPRLLELRAPLVLSPRARRLTFRVATTIPAVLAVGGRRHAVDRRLRPIGVAVEPGRAVLRIPLRLTAGGRTVRTDLVIERR